MSVEWTCRTCCQSCAGCKQPAATAAAAVTAATDLARCAVLDIVARVDHELLQKLGAEPGGCLPVSAEEMARLLAMPELRSNMMRYVRVSSPVQLLRSICHGIDACDVRQMDPARAHNCQSGSEGPRK